MIEIVVKVYHKRFPGDKSYHIEKHFIKKECLKWWQERSGNGDFELL